MLDGLGTVTEWNAHYRRLARRGAVDLPVVFDEPTRLGYDSDSPAAHGTVGGAGVCVDSVDDMRVLLRGIPLDRVRPSLEIDAPAAVLLLLYELVAEEQGVPGRLLAGAVRGDVLTRGAWMFPPGPSLRLVADTFVYCRTALPRWSVVSLSGGGQGPPVQEVAFTLAKGVEYVRTAVAAGMSVHEVVPRITLPVTGAARHRGTRHVWARVLSDRFGVRGPHTRAGAWESAVLALVEGMEASGGAVAAAGYGVHENPRAACCRPVQETGKPRPPCPNSLAETQQSERLAKLRAWRVEPDVTAALERLRTAASGRGNVLHPMKEALRARATVGEVCGVLRGVWGA